MQLGTDFITTLTNKFAACSVICLQLYTKYIMRLKTYLFSVIFKRHCFVSYLAGCHPSVQSWRSECNAGAVVSVEDVPLP